MTKEATPIPRRFWWLKRLALAGLLLVLAVAGLRWYWGSVMSGRLNAAVERISQRGEPIELSDLPRPSVPDQQNSAHFLRQALNQWPKVNGKLITATDWNMDPAKHKDPITDNEAYLKRWRKQILPLLQKAAQAPKTDWDVKLQTPAIQMRLPQLSDMRTLARLLDDAAKRAHEVGDDRLAIELVRHQFNIADSVNTGPRTLLSYLVDVSIRALAVGRLEAIAPTLPIGANSENAARPAVVKQLIDRLLDEQARRRAFAGAMMAERVIMYDTMMALVEGRVKRQALPLGTGGGFSSVLHRVQALLINPLLKRDTLLLLNNHTAMIKAGRKAETHRQYTRLRDKLAPSPKPTQRSIMLFPLSQIMMPAMDQAAQASFTGRMGQQLAGVALAIRLYQREHDGRRPRRLAQLVPKWLDRVPNDVFARAPQPIQYKPGGVRPILQKNWNPAGQSAATQPANPAQRERVAILYSLGPDQQDDGGVVVVSPNSRDNPVVKNPDEADQVFMLDPESKLPQPPSPPPSATGPGSMPQPTTQPAPATQPTTQPN